MNGPVHSRGIGRSGPKRKTGCLTCRRRKVRCDEGSPVCQNCIRLRLECEYASPRSRPPRISCLHAPAKPAPRRASSVTLQASFFDSHQTSGIFSNVQTMTSVSTTTYHPLDHQDNFPNDVATSFSAPISNNFVPPLENFDVGVALGTGSETFLGPDSLSNAGNLGMTDAEINISINPTLRMTPNKDRRTQELLDHFVRSVNPTRLIHPTHTEWASACHALIAMADDCASVLYAVCSLSALNLYCNAGDDCFEEAFHHYKFASREVNAILDCAVSNDQQLLAQATSKAKRNSWSLQHLHSFHHRIRQHQERTRLWTGVSYRLTIWTIVLQTKAEWNSGDSALQHCSTALAHLIGDPFVRTISWDDRIVKERNYDRRIPNDENLLRNGDEADTRSTAELVHDTVIQSVFEFSLKSQAFTSRILSLHYYKQEQKSLDMDLETLKEGQRINADLHALWASRPSTVHFLRNPAGLSDSLQPELAQRVLLQLRVYVANFFAQFIQLHRVAFAAFSASSDVQNAVTRIIGLTKDILKSTQESRRSATQSPSTDSTRITIIGAPQVVQDTQQAGTCVELPAMMLFPLFLAATECDSADRLWILQVLKETNMGICPSLTRTVFLLEELLGRQDQEGKRVDHRSIREEMFDGSLSAFC